jgi:tRNA (guanine-N7-)-methyltransferase
LRFTRAQQIDQHEQQHYLRCYSPEALFHNWQQFPPLTSAALFENEQPLELEIGCGSGELLLFLARERPHTNFVGVDISRKMLDKAVEQAVRYRLPNLKFINADFRQMYPLLMPDTLKSVYLHFPDPHLRPRHQKRRLLNAEFLEQMHRALKPEGTLSVMTDVCDFFFDMLAIIEQDTRFQKCHSERYLTGSDLPVRSHFQRVWEGYGEQVYRCLIQKKA